MSSVRPLCPARYALPNRRARTGGTRIDRFWVHGLPSKTDTAARPLARIPTENVTQMPHATTQLRVLVIDDNADGAEALSALIATMGCTTAVAFSGVQGLAVATGFNPHMAFIDMEMPGMNGCEVARHFRANRPEGPARLICLTGRGHPDDRRTCMAAGFDDFYTKPITAANLSRVLGESRAVL